MYASVRTALEPASVYSVQSYNCCYNCCAQIPSVCFFSFLHIVPCLFFALLYARPLGVTQIWGHIAGAYLPLPPQLRALRFLSRQDLQPFLPSSTRVEVRLPTLGALSSWFLFFCFKNSHSHRGGIRTPGSTLLVAFEGDNHYIVQLNRP